MPLVLRVLLAITVAASSCSRAPKTREYELVGQILALAPERSEVTIKHRDVKNFMPGMTMPFTVKDAGLLTGKQPGDLVTATLVVGEVEAHLSTLTKTGHVALEAPAPTTGDPDAVQPGSQVRDAQLVDQDGAVRPFSAWRGHRVALTFMYTRCPFPEFCPLMDRHFAAVQKQIAARPELADVRLVSMTLDPRFDTPAVLKTHSGRLRANPSIWSFVTAAPADASTFATQFGLYVEENPESAIEITHNLRTAIIDADGRLVKIHTGNRWTPAELVADLTATAAPKN